VVTGPLDGVTDCGLKLQLAPAGRPEQPKLTACLNPFSGVTVSESLPDAPAVTLKAELLKENE
jgi:hypothetical protein